MPVAMEQELTIGAMITAVCGVFVELLRRWAKEERAARVTVARTMKEISDGQRADNLRAVETMIAGARTDAQVMAAVDALRVALNEAVEARRRDDAAVIVELRELQERVEALTMRLDNYDEFKRSVVYRPRG